MFKHMLTNKWLTWAIVLVILYAYLSHYDKKEVHKQAGQSIITPENIEVSSSKEGASFTQGIAQSVISFFSKTESGQILLKEKIRQELEKKMDGKTLSEFVSAQTGRMAYLDIKAGAGKPAFCGAKVTVSYTAFIDKDIQVDASGGQDITFTIGEKKVVKGLELGLMGMKEGGVRKIIVPPMLGFKGRQLQSNIGLENKVVSYVVSLHTVHAATAKPWYEIQEKKIGEGTVAGCGEHVTVRYKAFLPDGTIIPVASEEVALVLGEGKLPFGLEQGIVGMYEGGLRELTVTPESAFQYTDVQIKHFPWLEKETPVTLSVDLIGVK